MRSLRAGRLTLHAELLAWLDADNPAALVRRWRGAWRRFWAGVATMGEGCVAMPLVVDSVCPRCKKYRLKRHCTAETTPCPWLECTHCDWRLRPDLYEAEVP